MNRWKLVESDPYLTPYSQYFSYISDHRKSILKRILKEKQTLQDFAGGHEYFGLRSEGTEWVFREWAPNATALYVIGTCNDWQINHDYAFSPIGNGVWELRIPKSWLQHEGLFRLFLQWRGGEGERIPAYARRVVQDEHTKIFSAQV